jgi:hypothetical protein
MGLDIRIPIGLLFSTLGIVLVLSGVISDSAIYQRSLGINVNLWWGLIMLVFGVAMYMLGRRGGSSAKPAEASVEGRATERREHEEGLESEG